MHKKNSQLCWQCEKACGRCSWSNDLTPVPGWKATPTKILSYTEQANRKRKKVYLDSYDISECPEFEPLKIKSKDEFQELIKMNIDRIRRDQIE